MMVVRLGIAVAGGAAALSYLTLRRLLKNSGPSRAKAPVPEPGAPAWYMAPALLAHAIHGVCTASLSYIPKVNGGMVTPTGVRAANLGAIAIISTIQHTDVYVDHLIPRAWIRWVYTIAGSFAAACLPLHFASYYAIFPPITATALLLANNLIGFGLNVAMEKYVGEPFEPNMDSVSRVLHRSEHWWIHAAGDVAAGMFACVVLALLPPEATGKYIGWMRR